MKNQSIGAFWEKTSANGLDYLSGVIEIEDKKYYLAVFKNTRKDKDNQPDYNIYLSEKNDK